MSAELRAAVRAALRAAGHADRGALELAVHEVVTNAHEHGRPPVDVAVRHEGGRVEIVVRDAGTGPAGPPGVADTSAERGRGRWLAHQLAVVEERCTPEGYEVRLSRRG